MANPRFWDSLAAAEATEKQKPVEYYCGERQRLYYQYQTGSVKTLYSSWLAQLHSKLVTAPNTTKFSFRIWTIVPKQHLTSVM